MDKTITIVVTGLVQGVFFRQGTLEKARQLGITGFVSNQADGSVKIVATGDHEQLDRLVSWCRSGPPRATVTGLDIKEITLEEFRNFSIQRF